MSKEKWQRENNHLTLSFTLKSRRCQARIKRLAARLSVFIYLFLYLQMPLSFLLEAASLRLPRGLAKLPQGHRLESSHGQMEAPHPPTPVPTGSVPLEGILTSGQDRLRGHETCAVTQGPALGLISVVTALTTASSVLNKGPCIFIWFWAPQLT